MENQRAFSLIGIPDHEAIMNLNGRIGAAKGPEAFRRIFMNLKSQESPLEALRDDVDASPLGFDIKQNHLVASQFISKRQTKGHFTIVVGGGHDHGFSHLHGVHSSFKAQAKKSFQLGCINIDAHLDVRPSQPKITSGSPFYMALESKVLLPKNLIEFGIQRQCNAKELWDYVKQNKIPVLLFEDMYKKNNAVSAFQQSLKSLSERCDAIVVSLDLDALAQAYAPGVSAPQAEGFTSMEILEMMRIAGNHPKVASLGIFELNPLMDNDEQTARVAAHAAFHFSVHALKRKK